MVDNEEFSEEVSGYIVGDPITETTGEKVARALEMHAELPKKRRGRKKKTAPEGLEDAAKATAEHAIELLENGTRTRPGEPITEAKIREMVAAAMEKHAPKPPAPKPNPPTPEENAAMIARWHARDRIMASLELHHGVNAEKEYFRRYGPDGSGPWSGVEAYYQRFENEQYTLLALRMDDAEAWRIARERTDALRAEHQRAREEAGLS